MAKSIKAFASTFDAGLVAQMMAVPTNFIFELFEVEVGKLTSDGIGKLLVSYSNAMPHLSHNRMLDVLEVFYHLEPADFLRLPAIDQRRFFLDSIRDCLDRYHHDYGWNREQYLAAYDRIVGGGIQFNRRWGKPVKSPGRKRTACIHLSYIDKIDVSLVIADAQSGALISERLLTCLGPSLGSVMNNIKRIEWESPSTVLVHRANEEDYWRVHLESSQVDFHCAHAESGHPHMQYVLAKMYLQGQVVLKDEALGMHWMRESAKNGYSRAISYLRQPNLDEP